MLDGNLLSLSLSFIYLICILFTIDIFLFHMYMQGHTTITMEWLWFIVVQPPFNFVMKHRITTNDTKP